MKIKRGEVKPLSKKKIWFFAVNGFCLLCILAGLIAMSALRDLLPSQQTAERWKGENETQFAQVSVFSTSEAPLTEEAINSFRNGLETKLSEAGIVPAETGRLWADAYCAMGTASAAVGKNNVSADAVAVGGDFFLFHPLKLLDGQYIAGDDLMKDRVLVNEMLAWKLYGGQKIAGMEVTVNGMPCIIAGVFEPEDDFATELALDKDVPMMILSYDMYAQSESARAISAYEIVMPNPLTGYAKQTVSEQFGNLSGAETVDNTARFSGKNVRASIKNFGKNAMRKSAIVYPYWENAARCVEADLALLWLITAVFCILPLLTALYYLVRLCLLGRKAVKQGKKQILKKLEERKERRWEEKGGSSGNF